MTLDMKNLYLLPATSPSNVFFMNQKFHYSIIAKIRENNQGFHLYITCDDKIKEGDWFIDDKYKQPMKYFGEGSLLISSKKIILTTDQDLIKDGVQALAQKFVEWFVKNPSCEKVEIIRTKKPSSKSIWNAEKGDLVFNNHGFGGIIQELSDDIRVHILPENGEGYMETAITADNGKDTLIINNYKVYEYTGYEIIIPQEKLKQSVEEYTQQGLEKYAYELEPKQKTLEEVAKVYAKIPLHKEVDSEERYFNTRVREYDAFKAGAKWQVDNIFDDKELDFIKKLIEAYQFEYNLEHEDNAEDKELVIKVRLKLKIN